METSSSQPIGVEDPYGIEHGGYDPGSWLLSPVPMAFVCFGIAAIAARLAGRRFEWVGAAVALAAGVAIIAILQHESERLIANVRAHWSWLYAVTLLGVAGGLAARVAEPVEYTSERIRITGRIALRMLAAILLGSAVVTVPAMLFVVLMMRGVGFATSWALVLLSVVAIATGGWVAARRAPRFPIPCAVAAIYLPSIVAFAIEGSLLRELDIIVGALAVLSVPAAVAAWIASTRTRVARAQRERETDGFGFDLMRVAAFGVFSAALLGGVWSMARDNCAMQRERFARSVDYVDRIRSPADAVAALEASGFTARHVAGSVDGYRLEIDEASTSCNFYSPKTVVARHPR